MLTGKVAIVTGASSGIGEATALALAKAGAKVAIGARRTDRLEKLKDTIEKNGGEAFMQKLDVTKKAECDSFVDAVVKKWGTVDILVNNAGLMPLSFFKNLKVSEWDQMIDVNIKGVLYCTGAVIPHLVAKKSGHIVNLSSVAGRIVFPAGSVYCATKHAVAAFSEGLRQEFSVRYGIRVTSIEPGVVATELNDTITDESLKGFVEAAAKMVALQAQDIANAIVFAVDSPQHMNVNEILIRPTTQER
ncbi:MAG: SDR family oxidoreductase [Nitrososphaeria archaeon]|nr:SDR family oxidoreductase [Nitrososphaeria archaeon]NDB51677.1 SDR family oxidoreductase [Nitrosopumilaceae archaeon]NDB88204.1 SDR family oxidoreductase [Nitrososphaerota archaeon]NDB46562.1 SDR family oxidoreductase [Nitrososphaeria archaeon]NDB63462.1 SDR family oxidoreductase [Nitrosopumilaceae archaeon]